MQLRREGVPVSGEYVPAGQFMQALLPVVEYRPAAHGRQNAELERGAYVPPGHGAQLVAPVPDW